MLRRTSDTAAEGERRSLSPWHILSMSVLALAFWLEGYDFQVLALAVPVIARDWGVHPGDFSLALSAVYIGMGVAALALAPIGDRWGRKRMIVTGSVLLTLSLFATALAPSLAVLVIARLATGVALGMIIPNGAALVVDFAPPGARSSAMTLLTCCYALGAVMASFIAPPVIDAWSWPMTYIASGAATIALTVLIALWVPESLEVLRRDPQRQGELLRTLRRFRLPSDLAVPPLASERKAAAMTALELLRPAYRRNTLLWWGLFTVNNAVFTILVLWLPTLIDMTGADMASAMASTAMIWGGGIVGSMVQSRLLDRLGPKPAPLIVALGCAALALPFLIWGSDWPLLWLVALFLCGFGITGLSFLGGPIGAFLYPPRILAGAIGTAVAIPRLAGILAPLAFGAALKAGATPILLVGILIVPVLVTACLLGWLLPPRRPDLPQDDFGVAHGAQMPQRSEP